MQKGPVILQLKVGMLGDSNVGIALLIVTCVENKFEEDYVQTLGINFMEKTIQVCDRTITFTIFFILSGGVCSYGSFRKPFEVITLHGIRCSYDGESEAT